MRKNIEKTNVKNCKNVVSYFVLLILASETVEAQQSLQAGTPKRWDLEGVKSVLLPEKWERGR